VYYLGLGALKNKATSSATNNYGFDDERGDYYLVHHDHIAFRYEILDLLGKGSFSIVTKAYDHKTKRIVALKIMRNGKQFHQAATIEAKVLQYLNQKDTDESYNIITLHEVFLFRRHYVFDFELLGPNLYNVIRTNCFVGMRMGLIRRIAI
jgi:dual specificity tyrosine-phosphorylation-regulated kinase 2/3/4